MADYTSSPASGVQTLILDDANVSPGTVTSNASLSEGYGVNSTYTLVAFHGTTLPSIARVQQTAFSGSSSNTYYVPNTAGDLLIASCRSSGYYVWPTDTAGNTWIATAAANDPDDTYYYSYSIVPNAIAYSNNVVTCTGGDVALWEFQGLNTVQPIADLNEYMTGNTGLTSISSGNVTMPSSGLLFSVVVAAEDTTETASASGYNSVLSDNSTDGFQEFEDVVGSAGSYSITASFGAGTSSVSSIFLLALSSERVTYPYLRQKGRFSGNGFGSPTVSGNLIFAFTIQNSPGSDTTPTDSQSNTYHLIQGTNTGEFAVWYTTASANLGLIVSNANANCIGWLEMGNTSGATLDRSNSSGPSTASTSIGTGSITTDYANEVLLSVGLNYDESSITRLQFTGQSSPWEGNGLGCGVHDDAAFVGYLTGQSIGSYSNTFGWSGESGDSLTGAIASFYIPGGGDGGGSSSGQGQIISKIQIPDDYYLRAR